METASDRSLKLQAQIALMDTDYVRKLLANLLEETTQDDDLIRKSFLKVMTKKEVYGDEFYVPSIVDLVEKLVEKIQNNPLSRESA